MVEQLKQYLRQPQNLAIAIPALLVILLVMSFFHMGAARSEAKFQMQNVQESARQASEIKKLLAQMGRESLTGSSGKNFNGISSALECAHAAGIGEENLSRGESSKPSSQKDGYVLHRETYKISRVSLLKIAQFIDHAERNFADLQCTQIALIPTPGVNTRDNWSTTLSFTYTVK